MSFLPPPFPPPPPWHPPSASTPLHSPPSRLPPSPQSPSPSIEYVQHQVDGLKLTMQQNVRQALENTAKIEAIEVGAEDLERHARDFEREARRLRCKKCLRHWGVIAFVGVVVVLVIVMIVVGIQERSS